MVDQNKGLFIMDPIMSVCYVIEAHSDLGEFMESDDGVMINLFWSNDEGWVPYLGADVYDKDDYFTFTKPDKGVWVEVTKVFNLVASYDSFIINEVSQLTRDPVVHPDSFDDDNNFRAI